MAVLKTIHNFFRRMHKPYGKFSFVSRLRRDASILDVGCGNNSPFWTKQVLPDCIYTGIDVGNYNQTSPNLADRYSIVPPEEFTGKIAENKSCFDAVISSHNLEHCNDRDGTLRAIMDSLKNGGLLFLSFPSENSVNFPRRPGTLCYYDDPTHLGEPPHFDSIVETLRRNGFDILFSSGNYKPTIDWLFGFFMESRSRRRNFVLRGTRSYYGFDAVIWAKKNI